MNKIRGTHLLVLAAACGLIASGVGLVTNVAGLFFTPVADEFGILKGQVSFTLTICNICFALGGMLTPRLMKARSPKPLLIVATALLASSTAALTLCHGIVPMYVLCVVRGLSAGVVGMVFATSVLNNWFVEGIGLVTSIAFGCSGIAGALFSPVISGVIGAGGWRAGYLVMCALTVLLNLPAILFLPSVTPEASGHKALGATAAPKQAAKKTVASSAPLNMVAFGLLLAYSIICSGITGLPQHFPGMAESFGHAAVGATMLSVCMVANTAGKIALGALVDKFGAKRSILLYCALILVALIMFLFMRGPATLLVAAVLFGLCYSIATVGISMSCRDVFGPENYTRAYPTLSLGGNIANAAFSSIIGFMYDFSGGYDLTLWVFVAMTVATGALIVGAYRQKQ